MPSSRIPGDADLRDVVDDLSRRGLELLQGHLSGAEVRLVKPLTGGRSGARVWLCDIAATTTASSTMPIDGQYVLKISSSPLSASHLVQDLGTYAQTRVPHTLYSKTVNDLSVELYDLAGGSLDSVRTAESLSDHLDRDEVHRLLVSELLRAQLATSSVSCPSSIAAALEGWLGVGWLDEGHRGRQLNAQSRIVNPDQDALFRHGGELLPDPVLVAPDLLQVTLDGTIEGICHGDLHERNILVRGSRKTSDLSYWLIDFNWDRKAPLLYDHAYLECSLILSGLEQMSNPVLAAVLSKIDCVSPAAPASLDLVASVLGHRIEIMREAAGDELLQAEPKRVDLWQRQLALARIAAALNWASKESVAAERARAAYLVAAWNLRTWLRTYDGDRWQTLANATPAAASRRGQILEEAEILRLWSTFTLRNTGRDLFIVTGAVADSIDASPLAHCAWSAVIDLDPDSDVSGMASTVIEPLRLRRHVSVFGSNIQLAGPRRATNWLMANGWHSHGEVASSSVEEWRRGGYFRRVRDIIDVVRADSQTGTAAVLVLQPDQLDATRLIVDYIDEVYEAAPECLYLAGPRGIDAQSFLKTVRTSLMQPSPGGSPTIPGANGPVELRRADLLRLEVDLEVLHSDKLSDEGESSIAEDEFWRGRPPTWGELDAQIDLRRDGYTALRQAVLEALDPPRLKQVPVYHSPGAGGTTLGRRVAWELRLSYPTVRLRNVTDLTAERIDEIFRLSGKPVVVLAEAADLQPSDQENLFEKLRVRGTAAALLLITRSARRRTARNQLIDPMPLPECLRFIDAHLSRDLPAEARERLSDLRDRFSNDSDDSPRQFHSPFYIGLCAYGDQFLAIDRYVDNHLEQLPVSGRQVATHLALVTRYAQFALPRALIQRWSGRARPHRGETTENLAEALGPDLRNLVVVSSDGVRLLHPLIAERVLASQHGGAQQGLAQISVSFIRDLHRVLGSNSNLARKILADLFVRRAPISNGGRKGGFAEVVQAMPAEGGQLVFETLTDLYPREPHFWNHRGRYHIYVVKGDFHKAEAYLENAVKQAGNDAALHQHTLGMVRRFWIENNVENHLREAKGEPIDAQHLLEQIQPLYVSAMKTFADCRTGMTADHGLVTPLQLTAFVIEALVGASRQPNLPSLLATNTRVAKWIADQIHEAEALLTDLQAAYIERRSSDGYYNKLSAQYGLLYGDIEELVEQWRRTLKNDRGPDSNALGPALARTLFAQAGRSWSDVSEARSREIHEMLRESVSTGSSSDSDLRLWLQAYRRLPDYSETVALERLSSAAAELESLEAYYYLYVIHFMRWLRGDSQNQDRTRQFLEQCQRRARNKNRSWSYEWVGESEPAPSLVHFTELGPRSPGPNGFFSRPDLLKRLHGVIEVIDGMQAGRIRVMSGTLTAHFVPRSKFLQTRDINATVDFFLGFSFDGLRAWEVEYPGDYRGPGRPKTSAAQHFAAPIDSSLAPKPAEDDAASDPPIEIAGPAPRRKAERISLDLVACRDAIAGSSGDDVYRRAIGNLIEQAEASGKRLDSLHLGEALLGVLGPAGYERLKRGGKLRPAISRLGFNLEQGPGAAFYVSFEPDGF